MNRKPIAFFTNVVDGVRYTYMTCDTGEIFEMVYNQDLCCKVWERLPSVPQGLIFDAQVDVLRH